MLARRRWNSIPSDARCENKYRIFSKVPSAFSGQVIKIDVFSISTHFMENSARVKCRCARRGSGQVYFSKAIYHVFDYLSQRQVAAGASKRHAAGKIFEEFAYGCVDASAMFREGWGRSGGRSHIKEDKSNIAAILYSAPLNLFRANLTLQPHRLAINLYEVPPFEWTRFFIDVMKMFTRPPSDIPFSTASDFSKSISIKRRREIAFPEDCAAALVSSAALAAGKSRRRATLM